MSIEQRINLKFLVRLGKTPTETFNLLQEVYGDATMSRTRIFEWHKRFREGREDVEDDPKSGRPTTSRTNENVERVREKVRSDRRLTVRMIADELSMNSERVWRIITEDLGMRKVCAKMVPRLLNDGQKENRVQVCQDILKQLEITPDLLSRVVTGDESWMSHFQDSKAITTAVTKELRAIPMESFQKCIEAWRQRLEKCIRAQRDYFEGDKL